MKRLIRAVLGVVWFCTAAQVAQAQDNLLELKFADTKYGYADWAHTWPHRLMSDVFLVRVPGDNEFNLGGGYQFQLFGNSLTLIPAVYFAVKKEGGDKGIKFALVGSLETGGWKANCYIAHAFGDFESYQVLDAFDLTRTVKHGWDLGFQTGFFRQNGVWNPQTGPIVRFNDSKGAWAISLRFGPRPDLRELRFGRVFPF